MTSILKEIKFLTCRVCERSGVDISGAKKTKDQRNNKTDCRSSVECYVADDYIKTIRVFEEFVKYRMWNKHGHTDERVKALFDVLDVMLVDLDSKNRLTLQRLGMPKTPTKRQRVVKTQKNMEQEIKEKKEFIDLPTAKTSHGDEG